MRTSIRPAHELGSVLWDFRGQHHLSQKQAATALGVSIATIISYESGQDSKTKLPINPRENTLQLLAHRMYDYAVRSGKPYAGTSDDLYRRLLIAAGKLAEAPDVAEGAATVTTRPHGARKPIEISADLPEPPDEEELLLLRKLEDWPNPGPFNPRNPDDDYWLEPRVDRLRIARNLVELWEAHKAQLKRRRTLEGV